MTWPVHIKRKRAQVRAAHAVQFRMRGRGSTSAGADPMARRAPVGALALLGRDPCSRDNHSSTVSTASVKKHDRYRLMAGAIPRVRPLTRNANAPAGKCERGQGALAISALARMSVSNRADFWFTMCFARSSTSFVTDTLPGVAAVVVAARHPAETRVV